MNSALHAQPFIRHSKNNHKTTYGTSVQLRARYPKLQCINNLNLTGGLLSGFQANTIKTYRLRAGTESIHDLKQHPETQRYAMVAIFCTERRFEIIDGLIDLLIQIIHKIKVSAEKKVIT